MMKDEDHRLSLHNDKMKELDNFGIIVRNILIKHTRVFHTIYIPYVYYI